MRRGLKHKFSGMSKNNLFFGGAASPMRRGLKRQASPSRRVRLLGGGAASPMRRGLKQKPFICASKATCAGRRRLPDAKGIETCARWRNRPAGGHTGGAASPMRRGLKHSRLYQSRKGARGGTGGAASPMRRGLKQVWPELRGGQYLRRRRLPDAKGIETHEWDSPPIDELSRRRRLPDAKGIETRRL